MIDAIHDEQLAEHGGLPGVRNENGLEAALVRPQNKAACGDPTVFEIAAAYLFGITTGHPFADGNKRTGFLAAYTFLRINGYQIDAEEGAAYLVVNAVAAGEIDETGIAMWLCDHSRQSDDNGS